MSLRIRASRKLKITKGAGGQTPQEPAFDGLPPITTMSPVTLQELPWAEYGETLYDYSYNDGYVRKAKRISKSGSPFTVANSHVHHYPKTQPENIDGTIVNIDRHFFAITGTDTYTFLSYYPASFGVNYQWHHTDRNLVWGVTGNIWHEVQPENGTRSIKRDFNATWGWTGVSLGRNEGSINRADTRAALVYNLGGQSHVGIYNPTTDTLLYTKTFAQLDALSGQSLATDDMNWCSVSASGDWLVVRKKGGTGISHACFYIADGSFTFTGGFDSSHPQCGYDVAGNEGVFCINPMGFYVFATNTKNMLLTTSDIDNANGNNTRAGHGSMIHEVDGWGMFTSDTQLWPAKRETIAVKLDDSKQVRRYWYNRGLNKDEPPVTTQLDAETHAVFSRDMKRCYIKVQHDDGTVWEYVVTVEPIP